MPRSRKTVATPESLPASTKLTVSSKRSSISSVGKIKTDLYRFQEDALEFLKGRKASALFMEQGTGKTLTTIAFLQYLFAEHRITRVLIVCPLTVIDVWVDQIKLHWDQHPPLYSFLDEAYDRAAASLPGIFIINYERFLRLRKMFYHLDYDASVVDESHRIKNHSSKQSKAVAKIRSPIRLILTGTPIGNSPLDLWAQFRYLDPDALDKTVSTFRDDFCRKGGFMGLKWVLKPSMQRPLMKIVDRYAFRMTKDKAFDLPPEVTLTRHFELSTAERKAYNTLVEDLILSTEGFTVTTPLVVTQLMKLRQITGGFVKDDNAANQYLGDSKLQALKDYLKNDLPEGDRFVIFCVFKQEIAMIQELLKSLKMKFGVIAGGVDASERTEVVKGLASGELDGVVCQMAAGSVGIDLTAANHSIFYSTDYSYINYYQARARIHRHGQKKKSTHLHLIAKKTIDGTCHRALLDKSDVAEQALSQLRKERIRSYGR